VVCGFGPRPDVPGRATAVRGSNAFARNVAVTTGNAMRMGAIIYYTKKNNGLLA
jgi:hypothetical protein